MAHQRSIIGLTELGAALFVYALIGNYLVLPGYVRFIERGATSAAGNRADMDVFIGAGRTILWMLSFQLAVLCLGAAHALRAGLRARVFAGAMAVWIALWAWPSLPAPGSLFYAGFGSVLLVAIGLVLASGRKPADAKGSGLFFLFAIAFFALATWEICGLGSAGRMLHPEQAATPFARNLLVTQSSKLMIELVIAWGMLLLSGRRGTAAVERQWG